MVSIFPMQSLPVESFPTVISMVDSRGGTEKTEEETVEEDEPAS
jgi:hypothetical protein